MPTIQSPSDKIIVTITSKYIKDFGSLTKRLAIADGTSVHLEDFAQVVGTVVSLPKEISQKNREAGYSMDEIRVGDQVIFAFNVVFDFYQKTPDGEPIWRNRMSYKAKDYWLADITKIFAIIRGNEIIMINGFVMAMPYAEDRIFTQPGTKKSRFSKSSDVMHIGNPRTHLPKINVQPGDIIYYNPKKTQKYQINDKPFIILTQQQVLGKVN